MFKRKLSPLESRKRLLIAESEINRLLLARDCQTLAGELHEVTQPIKKLGALAAAAVTLISLVKAFRTRSAATETPKHPWLFATLLRSGLALWSGLRARQPAGNSHEPTPK